MRPQRRRSWLRVLLAVGALCAIGLGGVPALARLRSPEGSSGSRSTRNAGARGVPRWLMPKSGHAATSASLNFASGARLLRFATEDAGEPARMAIEHGNALAIAGLSLRVSGTVSVTFRRDQAGCAAQGACGESGTLTWHPYTSGALVSILAGTRSHPQYEDTAFVLEGSAAGTSSSTQGTTEAQTTDAVGASCADAVSPGNDIPVPVRHRLATIALDAAEPNIVMTRCAAPLASEIGSALGTVRVPIARLLAGYTTVRFPARRHFTAGGFTGTVTSSIRFAIGRRQVLHLGGSSPMSSRRQHHHISRVRVVLATYRARIAGDLRLALHGDATSALCEPLDACGFNGTTTVSPSRASFTADWGAIVPASVSVRGALRDLGLIPGRPGRRSIVSGGATWRRGATARSVLARTGETCTAAAPTGPLEIAMGRDRHAFGVALLEDSLVDDQLGFGRTSCPGPFDHHVILAEGLVPVGELRHRTFTVAMTLAGGYFGDDGWHGRAQPDLRITLVRGRIRERVVPASSLGLSLG